MYVFDLEWKGEERTFVCGCVKVIGENHTRVFLKAEEIADYLVSNRKKAFSWGGADNDYPYLDKVTSVEGLRGALTDHYDLYYYLYSRTGRRLSLANVYSATSGSRPSDGSFDFKYASDGDLLLKCIEDCNMLEHLVKTAYSKRRLVYYKDTQNNSSPSTVQISKPLNMCSISKSVNFKNKIKKNK